MLHIQTIQLSNYATHAATKVSLPSTGLLAVTGGNGAGKSTLLEAVAMSLWGETLRGEAGWREGQAGEVSVTTDRVQATRKKGKASTKLEWQDSTTAPVHYETTTKAQTALEAVIGSYDVWRRTCVLSSLDSAAFSLARDSDRKRLLEEFLGLGMFDAALDQCRTDHRHHAAKAQEAETTRIHHQQQVAFARKQKVDAEADLSRLLAETGGKSLDELRAEGHRLVGLHKAVATDAKAATERVQHYERVGLEEDAKAKAEEARLARLGANACPTCGQDTEHARTHMQAGINEAKAKAAKARESVAQALADAKADAADLEQETRDLASRLEAARSDFRVAESNSKQVAYLQSKIASAKRNLDELEAIASTHAQDSGAAAATAAHLKAVEQVLGLRGVRAQVLDHALGALEQQANAWLSRMPTEAGPLTVTLSGSTTQKGGSTVDAISLKVRGRPYASCSGGERRRVDVALLLALRELAVAAHGRDGTLFCDEVFDALDQQGQADVAAALREMAKERLVVVITHSPDLLAALRPDQHAHVTLTTDGAASVALTK